jgi:hypothetical protein
LPSPATLCAREGLQLDQFKGDASLNGDASNPTRAHSLSSLPTKNLSRRTERIIRVLERAQPGTRNARLFWSACQLRDIIVFENRLRPEVAEQLLVIPSANP